MIPVSPGRGALIAGFIGVVAATVAVLAWFALASPSDRGARVSTAKERLASAEALSHGGTGGGRYPDDALCRRSVSGAAAELTTRMHRSSQAAGLTLQALQVYDGGAASDRLRAVGFTLEAAGRYESVVQFLSAVGQGAPAVFVDEALLSEGNGEERQLSLKGRVLCLPSRR